MSALISESPYLFSNPYFLLHVIFICLSLSWLMINSWHTQEIILFLQHSGVTLAGLNESLTVGESATIQCMTNIAVTSIEWRDSSSDVLINATNQTVLEYTIPLVTDDLQGQEYKCVAVAGDTMYTQTVEIQVEGRWSTY